MNAAQLRRWAVPGVSGALIVLSWVSGRFLATAGDLLMIAAAVVAGAPVVISAIRALRVKVVGIDLLVSVAAIGAVAVGNYWEAAAVTFLFAIGHALENATLARTRSALAELVALAPVTATVVRDGVQVDVPAETVAVDETVLVKNGGRIPVDATVVDGQAAIDESSITGESIPVEKSGGAQVFAGTIVSDGFLTLTATGVGADTTLARIVHRVEEAQDAKARTQQFMERFSRWYTPAIIALALGVGVATQNLTLGLTLLVIGCPGALVISVPVALVAGIGRAARDGILIKGGEFLETAARIDTVALDKTGTVTSGAPELTDIVVRGDWTRTEVLTWAARAEAGSEHPLATPVLAAAAAEDIEVPAVFDSVRSVPGHGVLARVEGREVAVGNLALLSRTADEVLRGSVERAASVEWARRTAASLAERGRTPLLVAVDGQAIGALGVADTIRPEAVELIDGLHRAGVRRVLMLTGDAAQVAEAVAGEVGIDDVRAGLLPEQKLEAVRELQAGGRVVAMVGDGVNDAPALAVADIGIAMGAAGSPVAVETADIALMTSRLTRVPEAISLARRTASVMRQNVAIALVTVIALLAGVLFGGVTMAIGMLVHEASVLIVIVNAMRLLRRPRRTSEPPATGRRSIERRPNALAAAN